MHKEHIFREYDIRGVYNTDFDNEFAWNLGKSYGAFLKDKTGQTPVVTVGYDARLSSPQIIDALVDGFTSTGTKVYNLGLITTPLSYFSMFHMEDVTGGIMVTGSHNPPEYNGFKISMGKTTIFGPLIQELKKYIEEGRCGNGKETVSDVDIREDYVARNKKEFGTLKDIGIVLDCGNGAAGSVVKNLYNAVGLNPKILFEEPDGNFPNHHPDPTVEENVTDMKKEVIASGAKVGIGFDGDADRIGVVDQNGRFILGDEIMMMVARDILKDSPGSIIVGDVKCSDRLYLDIEKHGGKPIMWKTGHSLIKTKIKEEKAPFGGELSGHIFFSDRNYGYDDAPYAGLRLIEILGKTGKTIDELLDGIPRSFNTPEIRLETTEENKVTLVKSLQDHFTNTPGDYKVNYIDGVRVSYNDGWALVRSSNTQPVITMRFESHTEEGLNRIQSTIMELVNPLL